MLGETNSGGLGINGIQIGTSVQQPKENDMRIPTADPINNYTFGFTEPSSPAVGDIWYVLKDKKGVTSIELLDNNSLQVPVFITKQWNGSTWVNKPLEIYKDGQWQRARWYLIKDGQYKYDGGRWAGDPNGYGNAYKLGNFIAYSDRVAIELPASYGYRKLFREDSYTIDWTDISTLNFKVSLEASNSSKLDNSVVAGIYVSSNYTATTIYATANVKAQVSKTYGTDLSLGEQILTLNTSSVTGLQYCGIDLRHGMIQTTTDLNIYDVWVE